MLKILKWTLISFGVLIGCIILIFFIYKNFFYEREMNEIAERLNEIENVEVLNIWGHEDITLEEVSARLQIKDKGEIVLYGLSEDSFNYPKRVPIIEIGGYSFTSFSCNGGIGPGIGIGSNDEFGNLIGKELNSIKDVIENYNLIINQIENLKMSPEINHFETENDESYLLVKKESSTDQDPIFNLIGIENKFDFAKTLKWNRNDCFYNK